MLVNVIAILLLAASTDSVAVPPQQQLLRTKLEQQIADADRRLDGVLGAAVLDLTTRELITYNADGVFPLASSIKIAILAELYRQSAAGQVTLDDLYLVRAPDLVAGSGVMRHLSPGSTRLTLRDLATLMIIESDNSATNVLIERIGMEDINALLERIGLKETRLRRKMMDTKAAEEGRENTSTPREMVLLLEAIDRGRLMPAGARDALFDILSLTKDSPLSRDLPAGVGVANKDGTLEGIRTDSGIIFLKDRPFAISVMTTYVGNPKAAEEAISAVGGAAFRYFDRLARSSPLGRALR